MLVTKPIDLGLLERELTQAAVPFRGLSSTETLSGVPNELDLFTYGPDGRPVDLPPEAMPVVDAHVAPPPFVAYVGQEELRRMLRTTDAAFHEIVRVPTVLKHVYITEARLSAVDATDGTAKATEARLVFKRAPSGLLQVGTTVALWTCQDSAAAAWAVQAQPSGTDLQIGVRGAAGRTIDWAVVLVLDEHAPEGL
jgi:hypothetical protein